MPSLVVQDETADAPEIDPSTPVMPIKKTLTKGTKRTNTSVKRRSSRTPPTSKHPLAAENTKRVTKREATITNQTSIATFFSGASTHTRTQSRAASQPTATKFTISLDAKESLRDIVLGVCFNEMNKESTTNMARRMNLPLPTICYPLLCTEALEEEITDFNRHKTNMSMNTLDDDDATIKHVEVSDEGTCLSIPLDEPVVEVLLTITGDASQEIIASEQTRNDTTTDPDIHKGCMAIESAHTTPISVTKKVTNTRKNMKANECTPSNNFPERTLETPKVVYETNNTSSIPLPSERSVLLAKNEQLRQKYLKQSAELIQQGMKGVAEEAFQIPKVELPPLNHTNNGTFPEGAVAILASLVQERCVTLIVII